MLVVCLDEFVLYSGDLQSTPRSFLGFLALQWRASVLCSVWQSQALSWQQLRYQAVLIASQLLLFSDISFYR